MACWTDQATAQAFRRTATTVHNVRPRFVEQAFEAALVRKKQSRPFPARRDSFDGAKEARFSVAANRRAGKPTPTGDVGVEHLLSDS